MKGFGGFAKRVLCEGEFIGEFAGEIIETAELNRRKRLYDAAGVGRHFCYVFDLGCGLQVRWPRAAKSSRTAVYFIRGSPYRTRCVPRFLNTLPEHTGFSY